MKLQTPQVAAVRRTWTIELRRGPGGPLLVCSECPSHPLPVPGNAARPTAMAHLADHAHRNSLPPHLRTCQCQERGCRWHPRHRGCAGTISLVLTGSRSGRLWRLADICSSCAHSTPHATTVPDTAPAAPPRPGETAHTPRHHEHRARTGDVLLSLASALPPGISAEARLLALQCALRADTLGRVYLPPGLLRAIHLHRDPLPWQDLQQSHWLHPLPAPDATSPHGNAAQLLDPAVLASASPQRLRRQAADWILRTCYTQRLRPLPPPVRLASLVLAVDAHTTIPHTPDRLHRLSVLSGLSAEELGPALRSLPAAAAII